MKNHIKQDGRLLQTNKKWSDLKQAQRTWILSAASIEHLAFIENHCKPPMKESKEALLEKVYESVKTRNIWIPYGEFRSHVGAYIDKLNRKYSDNEKAGCIMFQRDDVNIFTLKYDIHEYAAGEIGVSLYAEISDKPEFPEQGAYMLDIYLSIENIGFRDYVVGMVFGEKGMDKADIIEFVETIIKGQLDGDLRLRVDSMLDDERAMDLARAEKLKGEAPSHD